MAIFLRQFIVEKLHLISSVDEDTSWTFRKTCRLVPAGFVVVPHVLR